jgi:hypothetical protein
MVREFSMYLFRRGYINKACKLSIRLYVSLGDISQEKQDTMLG